MVHPARNGCERSESVPIARNADAIAAANRESEAWGALTATMSGTEPQQLLRLAGEGDMTVSGQLRELLAAVLAGAQQLVVDVSDLRFIDVACVRVLVEASGSAEDAGAPLELTAPQPIVARMLELCRTDQLIAV